MSLVHLDFAPRHEQPVGVRVVLATVLSIIGSLLVDAILVVIAQAAVPSTKGYVHFQFADYSKLTIIGVIIACVAWPITTRITSQPRWMFFRMAIAVTLVLWLPDVYLLVMGESSTAVAFLFLMHLAIALVTYNALVHLAPVGARERSGGRGPGGSGSGSGSGWQGTGWQGTGWQGTGWQGTGWQGTGWQGTGWQDSGQRGTGSQGTGSQGAGRQGMGSGRSDGYGAEPVAR